MGPVTSCKLDEFDYLVWSLSFTIYITTQDRLKHLNNAPPKAPIGDKAKSMAMATWKQKDAHVKSWFMNSVESHVANTIVCLKTTKDRWGQLAKIYSLNKILPRYMIFMNILVNRD